MGFGLCWARTNPTVDQPVDDETNRSESFGQRDGQYSTTEKSYNYDPCLENLLEDSDEQQDSYCQSTERLQYPVNCHVVCQVPLPDGTVRPPDYLWLAVISIIFCPPLGIISVCYSTCSKKSCDLREFDLAAYLGRMARNFAIIAIVVGIVVFNLLFGLYRM